MPAQWTADVVGKMHLLRISKRQIAEQMGVTPEYVSMVLNGHRDGRCRRSLQGGPGSAGREEGRKLRGDRTP